ncbi:MAG: hypothetical protein ACI4WR_07940, partial [Bulleidia sp.]
TILMIARRLKTVRHADQISVIDRGRIVQSGTHEQLMAEEGIYQRFVKSRQEAISWKYYCLTHRRTGINKACQKMAGFFS